MPVPQDIQIWLTSSWFNLISLGVGIIGILVGIISYFKSRKVKLPCYTTRSTNIVRDLINKFESVQMFYAGQPIENMTVTKIAFWNSGNETLNAQDIAAADPLRIHVKNDSKILDAKILYQKNKANKFELSSAEKESDVYLRFDYVDKYEGAVVQIIHTGKSNQNVVLEGKIKGTKRLKYNKLRGIMSSPDNFIDIFQLFRKVPSLNVLPTRHFYINILFIQMLPIILVFPNAIYNSYLEKRMIDLSILSSLFILFMLLLYKIYENRLPKGFDIFQEEI